MTSWFIPSWSGDFRLDPVENDPTLSALLITKPTPREVQLLDGFLATARKRKWLDQPIKVNAKLESQTIMLSASVAKAGAALVKATKPLDRTLTAVVFEDGKLKVAETSELDGLVTEIEAKKPKAAVSVARPTPSCPSCVPGSIGMASEVLLAFLDEQQHVDWAEHRAIITTGGNSGHRYLIAHRHSDTAQRLGKICYDLDDRLVLHFHDWSVPPEEEVLASMLILHHREAWLRNEATVLWWSSREHRWIDLGYSYYKNPFGGANDGAADAGLVQGFGIGLMTMGVQLKERQISNVGEMISGLEAEMADIKTQIATREQKLAELEGA